MISLKMFIYPLGVYYKKYIRFFYNFPKNKNINTSNLIIKKNNDLLKNNLLKNNLLKNNNINIKK
jgi:hypothetical protein